MIGKRNEGIKKLATNLQPSKQDADDTISRKAAIDEIEERKYANGYRNVAVISELNRLEGYIMRLPSVQPETHEKRTETHACDCIERKAVEHLDRFAKLYCRDKSITDDLAFRCGKCKFEMPDKTCLVKVMARKLCPEYKDFGAMGDL